MAGGHRLVRNDRHHKVVAGRVRVQGGGGVWGCGGCSWMTVAGTVVQAASAHRRAHRPRVEVLTEQLAEARAKLADLVSADG